MQNSYTRYRVRAEMEDCTGIVAGTIKWLGANPLPCWTEESLAMEFDTKQAIATFFVNGNGYPVGLYRPKPGTIRLVERTIQTTTRLRESRLQLPHRLGPQRAA